MRSYAKRRRELHDQHIKEGRCVSCYNPATSNSVYCSKHKEMARLRGVKNSLRFRNSYKEENRCTRCGVPLEDREGKVTCVNCSSPILRRSMTSRYKEALCSE